jgi:hypothetical protein
VNTFDRMCGTIDSGSCIRCVLGFGIKKLSMTLVDVVYGFKSFSEAPRLARKCGTRRSDSPVRAL